VPASPLPGRLSGPGRKGGAAAVNLAQHGHRYHGGSPGHRPSPILLMAHLKGSGAVVRMIKFSQDVAVLQGSCQPGSNGRVRSQGGKGNIREFSVRWTIERGMAPTARISQNNSRPLFRNHFSFRLFQSSVPCSACPRRPSCCSHRQSRDAQRLHHRSSAVRA
jgi:hypothetical protein